MLSVVQQRNLDLAADAAVMAERNYGLPARVTVAQWALESGWGMHAPGNNCFGIKHYPGAYGCQSLSTHEGACPDLVEQQFATFRTLSDCFEYHARLLTGYDSPYATAWRTYQQSGDAVQFAKDIAPHYAPENPNYASTLTTMMLYPYINKAIDNSAARL